jgi:ATP-dependent DNA ligase
MAPSVRPPIAGMLAKAADDVPEGEGWRYEPNWDGIRALGFRDGPGVVLRSRDDRRWSRYFPEVVTLLAEPSTAGWAIDGEILVVRPSGVAFNELLQRIHPAEPRVRKLAAELASRRHPADPRPCRPARRGSSRLGRPTPNGPPLVCQ